MILYERARLRTDPPFPKSEGPRTLYWAIYPSSTSSRTSAWRSASLAKLKAIDVPDLRAVFQRTTVSEYVNSLVLPAG